MDAAALVQQYLEEDGEAKRKAPGGMDGKSSIWRKTESFRHRWQRDTHEDGRGDGCSDGGHDAEAQDGLRRHVTGKKQVHIRLKKQSGKTQLSPDDLYDKDAEHHQTGSQLDSVKGGDIARLQKFRYILGKHGVYGIEALIIP